MHHIHQAIIEGLQQELREPEGTTFRLATLEPEQHPEPCIDYYLPNGMHLYVISITCKEDAIHIRIEGKDRHTIPYEEPNLIEQLQKILDTTKPEHQQETP